MTEPFIPDYTVHVSQFIQDELDARGWTKQEVYDRLGYDADDCRDFDHLMQVQDPNTLMSKKLADGLAYVFTVDADLFSNLHEAWRTHPLTKATSNVLTFTDPRS